MTYNGIMRDARSHEEEVARWKLAWILADMGEDMESLRGVPMWFIEAVAAVWDANREKDEHYEM
jgi:hypothetical protein